MEIEKGSPNRLAALVQLSVLGWSATILTAGYLGIVKADPTFVASVFTGCLAHYGITRGGQGKEESDRKQTPDPQPVKKS